MLPGDSSGCSRIALQRLDEMASETDCEIREKLAWSAGAAQFDPERHATVEDLIADADALMYSDKARQRTANG